MMPYLGPEFTDEIAANSRFEGAVADQCSDGWTSMPSIALEVEQSHTEPQFISNERRFTALEIRTLAIASLGSAFEFYDFVVFVFLTDVVGRLFFPPDLPPWVRQVETLAMLAAGYLVRPIGGVIMGHLSDRRGRKATFTLTIVLMAVATLLIGCLPTYRSVGIAAPLLLLFLRMGQGVAIGGEAPSAWVFVAENVPAHRQGLAVGLLTAGLSSGILLGSIVSVCLSGLYTLGEILNGAWRIAFILGGVFGLAMVMLRRQIAESPVFQEMQSRAVASGEMPIRAVTTHYKKSIALSMLLTWSLSAIIIVAILAGPTLLHGCLAVPLKTVQNANAAGTLSLCLSTAVLGFLSDRFGMRQVLGPALILLIGANYMLYVFANSMGAGAVVFFYVLVGIGAGATVLTPIIMIRSFPTSVRVTGVAFSYNTAYAIFGGVTPPFIGWLSHMNRLVPAHYTALAATVALLIVFLTPGGTWNLAQSLLDPS